MGASLEVRVPYMDNHVLDYALRLKLKEKSTARFPNKAPLKELLVKLAPHYNIDRPKKGFNFPLREWLTKDWRDLAYSFITRDNLKSMGVDEDNHRLLDIHYRRRSDRTMELWNLLNLTMWLDNKKRRL